MIHDLVATVFDDGCANFGGECVQHLIPGGALLFAFATFACTFHGIEDALRVIDLVDGGWSLGAVVSLVSLVSVVADVSDVLVRAAQAPPREAC